jgi:restriction system protein
MQHQAQLTQKRNLQLQAAASRAHQKTVQAAERAQRDSERAQNNAAKSSAAAQKSAQQEATRLHRESRIANTEELNSSLEATYAEIDSILVNTLLVDDFVDLNELRVIVRHKPFEPTPELTLPTFPAVPTELPPEPKFDEPPEPKGLSSLLGGKKRHEQAVTAARLEHTQRLAIWSIEMERIRVLHVSQQFAQETKEDARVRALAEEKARYDEDCRRVEAEIEKQNSQLDTLINGLAFDVPAAIQEYVGIVLSNSVYPDSFPVDHEFTFDIATRELTMTVFIPEPSVIPTVKEYKYVPAKDEIAPTQLPQKSVKDRYSSAVVQVAIRSLHEVFEADRASKIHSISLTVAVQHLDAGTGKPTQTPVACVSAEKEGFSTFDLAKVVPLATLQHLAGVVSKNCYDLVPVDSTGVRKR